MVINAPCSCNKALASPKQTAIVKDFPNPFMAGSLPKTIKQSNDPLLSRGYTLGSGEDSLKLMELMATCTKLSTFVRKKNREIWSVLTLMEVLYPHNSTLSELQEDYMGLIQ
ncbi:hypothetical protein Tco_0212087 [Tanacetum coccineum]